jgi:hypothetical protein
MDDKLSPKEAALFILAHELARIPAFDRDQLHLVVDLFCLLAERVGSGVFETTNPGEVPMLVILDRRFVTGTGYEKMLDLQTGYWTEGQINPCHSETIYLDNVIKTLTRKWSNATVPSTPGDPNTEGASTESMDR